MAREAPPPRRRAPGRPVLKLVHAADLHVDSPLQGLARYEEAPVEAIRGATRRALENLVQLCFDQRADVLLLAGDLFDGDGRDHATGLFFTSQLARLREADVQVVLVRGNHDAQSRVFQQMRHGDHVHELSQRKPDTWLHEGLGLAVHGQGFAERVVTDDLAAALPDARAGLFNVGLLHTSLDGRPGHDAYAPTSVDVLASKGYDYWALGHVHAREVVRDEPYIVFPGNIQGRHVRETGAKGASVVHVEDGRVVELTHWPLDVLRWAQVEVDAAELGDVDGVVDAVGAQLAREADGADGRLLAARVRVVGASSAHGALLADPEGLSHAVRGVALELLGHEAAWIESVRVDTRQPMDLEAVRQRDDALGGLARSLAALPDGAEALAELADELAALTAKLPAPVREGPEGLRLDDPALLAELVRDAEQLLLPRLLEAEGD